MIEVSQSDVLPDGLLDGLGVTTQDIEDFKENHCGLCGIEYSRLSKLLFAQLTQLSKYRLLNTFAITDVIQKLEGVGRPGLNVRENSFKGEPLKKFRKVHFFEASFLEKNLFLEWELHRPESNRFEKLCKKAMAEEENNPSLHGWQGRLAYEYVTSGYQSRVKSNKLTGEWLIYVRYNRQNYYLCVSQHFSSNKDGILFDNLKYYCGAEFPFLF